MADVPTELLKQAPKSWRNIFVVLTLLSLFAASVGFSWDRFAGLDTGTRVALIAGATIVGAAYLIRDGMVNAARAKK